MDLPSPPHLSHNHSVTPREMANSICDTLRRSGYQALLVGGCVRDLLLGREPADYDVTTDATPEQVVSLFPESIAVGAQFGVILIPRDGLKVEVATFRSDVGYSDGRHPDSVVYSKTPQEDVQRRDFSINGLLMRHDTGEVLDFVGGQADLEAKVIRAIGEPGRRFAEDKLRMMRAVRFAARSDSKSKPKRFGRYAATSARSTKFPQSASAKNSPNFLPKARPGGRSNRWTKPGSSSKFFRKSGR